jgi:acetylornithine/N-succinyldiaminopimelate aminotransferase
VLQGEGGIVSARVDYLRALRELCNQKEWLLMIDEVQSGIGRTGKWFAYQWADVLPDVLPLAKGLASGFPLGACLARGVAANVFKPGNHGTTFGGGPLACVTSMRTLEIMEEDGLLDNAAKMGMVLKSALEAEFQGIAAVKEIRGQGLMLGVELDRPCGDIVAMGLKAAEPILTNVTQDNVIRVLPPLIINESEAREIAKRLGSVVKAFLAKAAA